MVIDDSALRKEKQNLSMSKNKIKIRKKKGKRIFRLSSKTPRAIQKQIKGFAVPRATVVLVKKKDRRQNLFF